MCIVISMTLFLRFGERKLQAAYCGEWVSTLGIGVSRLVGDIAGIIPPLQHDRVVGCEVVIPAELMPVRAEDPGCTTGIARNRVVQHVEMQTHVGSLLMNGCF